MSTKRIWDHFTARRFRGLRDLTLEDLGIVNVLVGANGTGKTSLLEAIFLLAGSGNLTIPIHVQQFRNLPVEGFDELSYLFHECNTAAKITLSATTNAPISSRELSITARERSMQRETIPTHGQGEDSQSWATATVQSSTYPPPTNLGLRYDLTISGAGDSPRPTYSGTLWAEEQKVEADAPLRETIIPAQFLDYRLSNNASEVGNVVVNKKKGELLEYLRSVNPRVLDIGVSGKRAYIDIGLARMLPINMFGSGMIRACSIIAKCLLGSGQILLIDEVSSGLHYKALSPLLRAVIKFSIQNEILIFLTTHNLDVLRSLQVILGHDEMAHARDALACYALQRDKDGQVRAYRYGHRHLDHCIQHGIEIR